MYHGPTHPQASPGMGFCHPQNERWRWLRQLSSGPRLWGTACRHLQCCQVPNRPGRSSHPAILPEPKKRTGKAERPGFSADSLGGGASSQAGKARSAMNSSFLPWTLTGTRMGPRATDLDPPNPEPQGAPRLRGHVRLELGHIIPLGRWGSLHGQLWRWLPWV